METTLSKEINSIVSMPQNIQRFQNTLSREVFDKGMAWLEAAKRDTFPPETLEVWFCEMNRLKWSEEVFRERIIATVRVMTYGKVKFEDIIGAPDLLTKEQANELADRICENRRRNAEKIGYSQEEIENMGLVSFQEAYARRRAEVMDRVMASLEKRLKAVERYIKAAPEEIKLELREILENKGLAKSDDYWRQTLYLHAPNLIYEVEKMMKRL